MVWDSDTNIKEVMLRVAGLLKGCGCKTGCQTQHCGCKRKNNVVKAVNAQIVQTLMILLKLYIYTSRENYEFIAASREETISDSPLTEDMPSEVREEPTRKKGLGNAKVLLFRETITPLG